MYLRDDEIEAADEWIINLQDLFAEATTIKISHVNNLEVVNARARAEAERQEIEKREREHVQRMTDQSLVKRDAAKAVFETLHKSATHMLEADKVAISVDARTHRVEKISIEDFYCAT